MIDSAFHHAGDGPVVFGRYEQDALSGRDLAFQPKDRRRLVNVVVFVVQRQVANGQVFFGRRTRQRESQVPVVRIPAQADQNADSKVLAGRLPVAANAIHTCIVCFSR